MPHLTINDLPMYSPWPARLLGLEPWAPKEKTPAEITREYEQEKWGPLLTRVRSAGHGVTLAEVNQWMLGDGPPSVFCDGESFELMEQPSAYQRYIDFVSDSLQVYGPVRSIVELGAGHGGVLLDLASRPVFAGVEFLGGEYTRSGEEIIRLLAAATQLRVSAGHCDFARRPISDLIIPAGSLLYTSYATPCVRHLPSSFVEELAALRPKAVLHFEPCLEHCESGSLLGLLRRRYIEVNGYNVNLVTLLKQQEREGRIRILDERPAVMGMNPLLVVSTLVWEPRA